MNMVRENEVALQGKPVVPPMSFRQQMRHAIEISREVNQSAAELATDDQIRELEDYLQDEETRVRTIQKSIITGSKYEIRSKLIEEANKVYKPIKKTIFLERKHIKLAANEIMVCCCKEPIQIVSGPFSGIKTVGCGKKCLNRVVSTECCATLCPAKDRCTNRRFQLQQHVQVYPIKTEGRGWGLAAGQNIRKGQFVIQYLGEVYSIDSELGLSRLDQYKNAPCTYLMSTSHNEVIDPARRGNMARFINHSCDPNCETQKWNVLGEVCVGIFARRKISEDEELTFDYRLDMHKTTLTMCLCGTSKCRQYLGVIPTDFTQKTWSKAVENLKCSTCKKVNDAKNLILCDVCNNGWHIYCLKTPLKEVPKGPWACLKCGVKTAKKSSPRQIKQETEEIKINLEKKHLEILKGHIDEILEMNVKLFWDSAISDGFHEVTIRGANAKKAEKRILDIKKKAILSEPIEDEVIEIELKFEKIYLKNVLDFYNKKKPGIHLTYDEQVCLEEIFSIDQQTCIILTGRRKDVFDIADLLFQYIDNLVIFTLPISQTESKIIEANFSVFKNLNFPVEVKLSRDKVINESSHPFYFYSLDEKKLVFIGTESEVSNSYKFSTAWLINQFSGEIDMCFHFILPTRVGSVVKKVKLDIIDSLRPLHSNITPVIKFFDPILPRKYLTVLLIGSWRQIVLAKKKLLGEIKRLSGYEEMDQFFSFVHAQMYRHIFKNGAKFIHAIEKWMAASPQSEVKKVYILKFWDVYSPEVICPGSGPSPVEEFRAKIMSHLHQDTEALLNLIRLCESEAQIEYLLRFHFKISIEETLRKSCLFFGNFCKEFEGKGKVEYYDGYLHGVSYQLIDNSEEEDLIEENSSRMVDKIIEDVRMVSNTKAFNVFPVSYGTDIDMSTWNPAVDSKLNSYLNGLDSRKFILGTENLQNQIIPSVNVLFNVKEKADIMIGCSKNPSNILFVMLSDSQKK